MLATAATRLTRATVNVREIAESQFDVAMRAMASERDAQTGRHGPGAVSAIELAKRRLGAGRQFMIAASALLDRGNVAAARSLAADAFAALRDEDGELLGVGHLLAHHKGRAAERLGRLLNDARSAEMAAVSASWRRRSSTTSSTVCSRGSPATRRRAIPRGKDCTCRPRPSPACWPRACADSAGYAPYLLWAVELMD